VPEPDLRRLRVDQVGSLLRPARLKDVFTRYARRNAEEDELRQSATEIIRKIGKPAVEPLAVALEEADDRLKTRILKVLDRMGYKPKPKETEAVKQLEQKS